jgi:hypothetical protein
LAKNIQTTTPSPATFLSKKNLHLNNEF